MLIYEDGDIVADKQYDIFCHQVNCMATMGAGIAKQIKNVYPEVATKYYQFCWDNEPLGKVLYVKCNDGRYCVNMFAQHGYGHDKVYTDYEAFDSCLEHLKKKLKVSSKDLKVGIPYKIGCGLAGGDWSVIEQKLKQLAEDVPQNIYIVKKVQNV